MSNVTAISRGDFDRSKSPLFRIAVNESAHLEDASSVELLAEVGNESLRELAIKLWELTSARGRLPGIREMFGDKWGHFANHSLIIDVAGGVDIGSLRDMKLDHIPDVLQDLVDDGEIAEGLAELFLPPIGESIENFQPVSFDFYWKAEGESTREFNGAVLPFGNAKIRSVMIVIEELENIAETTGECVLNLDESSMLIDENGNNQQASGDSEASDSFAHDKPVVAESGRSAQSVVDLISEARVSALNAQEAEERSRLALYAALGRAYDLALCAARNPEIFAAQLIFGEDCSEGKLASYTSILAEALGQNIAQGELESFLQGLDGGIEALISANRKK